MYTYYSEVALQVILNSPPHSITNGVIEHLQINIHRSFVNRLKGATCSTFRFTHLGTRMSYGIHDPSDAMEVQE